MVMGMASGARVRSSVSEGPCTVSGSPHAMLSACAIPSRRRRGRRRHRTGSLGCPSSSKSRASRPASLAGRRRRGSRHPRTRHSLGSSRSPLQATQGLVGRARASGRATGESRRPSRTDSPLTGWWSPHPPAILRPEPQPETLRSAARRTADAGRFLRGPRSVRPRSLCPTVPSLRNNHCGGTTVTVVKLPRAPLGSVVCSVRGGEEAQGTPLSERYPIQGTDAQPRGLPRDAQPYRAENAQRMFHARPFPIASSQHGTRRVGSRGRRPAAVTEQPVASSSGSPR